METWVPCFSSIGGIRQVNDDDTKIHLKSLRPSVPTPM